MTTRPVSAPWPDEESATGYVRYVILKMIGAAAFVTNAAVCGWTLVGIPISIKVLTVAAAVTAIGAYRLGSRARKSDAKGIVTYEFPSPQQTKVIRLAAWTTTAALWVAVLADAFLFL